jgi:hypothetical protein
MTNYETIFGIGAFCLILILTVAMVFIFYWSFRMNEDMDLASKQMWDNIRSERDFKKRCYGKGGMVIRNDGELVCLLDGKVSEVHFANDH